MLPFILGSSVCKRGSRPRCSCPCRCHSSRARRIFGLSTFVWMACTQMTLGALPALRMLLCRVFPLPFLWMCEAESTFRCPPGSQPQLTLYPSCIAGMPSGRTLLPHTLWGAYATAHRAHVPHADTAQCTERGLTCSHMLLALSGQLWGAEGGGCPEWGICGAN